MKRYGLLAVLGTVACVMSSCAQAQQVPVASGLEQLVISADQPSCDVMHDRPDSPAHAFRDAKGNIQLIASSNDNYRQVGPDFDHLKRDCNVIFKGAQDGDPTHFSNEGWIHGTYTEDGKTIYALLHNEYWGSKFIPACNRNYNSCWWNNVTWAKSTDQGKTFVSPPVDERLVAGFSYPYVPNVGHPVGFMNPSNIVEKDDYLYAFMRSMGYKRQASGNFLIRKSKEAAWNDWQIWNGTEFTDIDPLLENEGPVGKPVNVGRPDGFPHATPMTVLSVVKHEPSGLYIATMGRGTRLSFKSAEQGFYIATSTDLINWSDPQQVAQGSFDCNKTKKGPQSFYRYYSLIDPTSTDRNFATVGDNPYIFTSRITVDSCTGPKHIDLVRIPIKLELPAKID